MLDDSGRPPGYGQNSPFQDAPQAPGQVPQTKLPQGTAGGAIPSVPTDPTLAGWRQPTMPRALGAPHVPTAPPVSSPLNTAILGPQNPLTPGAPGPMATGTIGQIPGQPDYSHDFSPRNPDQTLATGGLSQAPPPAQAPTAGAPQTDHDKTMALLQKYHSTDDPSYWDRVESEHGGFDKMGASWLDNAIMRGDGAEGVRNGTVAKRPSNAARPNSALLSAIGAPTQAPDTTGNNNPLLNALRQQLMQRPQPQVQY